MRRPVRMPGQRSRWIWLGKRARLAIANKSLSASAAWLRCNRANRLESRRGQLLRACALLSLSKIMLLTASQLERDGLGKETRYEQCGLLARPASR